MTLTHTRKYHTIMKLKQLEIQLEPQYSPKAGQYTGRIKFTDPNNQEITLVLDAALSTEILKVVSEQLVATAKRLATELTTTCIEMAAMPADIRPLLE